MNNPTYDMDTCSSLAAVIEKQRPRKPPKHAMDSQSHPADEGGQLGMYEPINKEGINDAEYNLGAEADIGTMPYAIHEFMDENSLAASSNSKSAVTSSQKQPMKVNRNKRTQRSFSASDGIKGKASKKPTIKPPVAKKGGPPPTAASKPFLTSERVLLPPLMSPELGSDPQGAYSELDKKTSYATLEPHMGNDSDKVLPVPETKESYCHLNH